MFLLFTLKYSLFNMKTFKLNGNMSLDSLEYIELYIFKNTHDLGILHNCYCDEYCVCECLAKIMVTHELLLVDDINLSKPLNGKIKLSFSDKKHQKCA